MSIYSLRKNFTAIYSNIRAKIAFKTKDTSWLGTQEPVIILMSVHSALHEGCDGHLKVNALVRTIRGHVKGPVTILIADRAHLRAQSRSFETCLQDARALHARYQPYLEGCSVAYWHSYIYQDESFEESLKAVEHLYKNDPQFASLVHADGADIDDLLEQCACILVLSKKGYRYQFYPGKPYSSTEYIATLGLQVTWVNVFLAIENRQNTGISAKV